MRPIILITISLFLLASCNRSGEKSDQGQSKTSKEKKMEKGNPKTQPADLIKLVQRQVVDREGTGLVATTYLLPSDWTVQDRLYWEYQDATVPIRLKANLQNADASMSIQIFPDIRSSWNSGPTGVSGYRPPKDIISGMKDLIAAERKGKNIRYVDQKVLLNESGNDYQRRTNAQAAVIKVSYDENNHTYEEEFYARLDIAYMVTPSMMGNMESILWAASGMYACKANQGKLDDCRKIAQTVASSAQWTKPFYNRLAQVIQLLSDQVYARIYQAGQISKIISQTNDQMIANIDASYRQSQQANDRTQQQFSDYIRGVDRYSDSGSEVQLPSGYSNAWVNDRGEYLITNTTGYNPGVDNSGNWKLLEKN